MLNFKKGRMAELVDALGSGPSTLKGMGVQIPLRPPLIISLFI